MRKYKHIRLSKNPIVIERISFINRVIKECLNESFQKITPTDYEIVNDGEIIIYRFKTDSNNSYDLEFINGFIDCNTKVGDGVISDYVEGIKIGGNKCFILTTDIAFVPSEINIEDRDNPELYTKETNRGEQFELMGRLSYLVKEYIKNNEMENIFVVGKDTKQIKLNIYNKLFDNLFSSDFIMVEGYNKHYDDGCFYFIKNK